MYGSFCALIKYIPIVLKKSYFIFPITKGSVNALMKLAGFSTSNKVKNLWVRVYNMYKRKKEQERQGRQYVFIFL